MRGRRRQTFSRDRRGDRPMLRTWCRHGQTQSSRDDPRPSGRSALRVAVRYSSHHARRSILERHATPRHLRRDGGYFLRILGLWGNAWCEGCGHTRFLSDHSMDGSRATATNEAKPGIRIHRKSLYLGLSHQHLSSDADDSISLDRRGGASRTVAR